MFSTERWRWVEDEWKRHVDFFKNQLPAAVIAFYSIMNTFDEFNENL